MNQELKTKWLAALRSGDYDQGSGQLRTEQDQFCCLGVLYDISERPWSPGGINNDYDTEEGMGGGFSDFLLGEFGFNDTIQGHLTDMNDSQNKSFDEIADWIEENL